MASRKEKNSNYNSKNQGIMDTLNELMEFEKAATGKTEEEIMDGVLQKTNVTRNVAPIAPEKNKFNPHGIADVVTFCEHPYYLNLKLHPWQRIILKIFYSGTEGNTHLKVDDSRSDGCDGCVWLKNKESEIKHLDSIKNAGIPKRPMMTPDNSPCLGCKRFDANLRQQRFDYIREQSITQQQEEEAVELNERKIEDLYRTEKDLLYQDLHENVRKQVEKKVGRRTQELILVLGRRSGKPISTDTPVLTASGWSTMGDLRIGDSVYGPDGKPTKIIEKSDVITDEDCYEVVFSNGEKITAGANHDWNVFDKQRQKTFHKSGYQLSDELPFEGAWNFIDIKCLGYNKQIATQFEYDQDQDMSILDLCHKYCLSILDCENTILHLKNLSAEEHGIYTTKELFDYKELNPQRTSLSVPLTKSIQFAKKELKIHPWAMGYLLGDGDTVKAGRVACDEKDKEFLMNKFLSLGFDVTMEENNDKHHFYIKGLRDIWREYGLHEGKFIPEDYLMSSEEDRKQILTGLLDSDASVYKQGEYAFINTNNKLTKGVEFLCCSLGIKFKSAPIKYSENHCSKLQQYRTWIHSEIPLMSIPRKEEKARHNWGFEQKSNYIVKITKLEKPVPIQCIQVNNASNCFLAGKTTVVVKNSFMVAVIALYEAYKLLMMGNPQAEFGLHPTQVITIYNVAVSEGQAKDTIFANIKAFALGSPFLKQYFGKPPTQTELYFLTPYDKALNAENAKQGAPAFDGSIVLKSGHSGPSSQMGMTMAVVIMDEMAEMGVASGENDAVLYEKLTPSVATFGIYGKVICISNPLGPSGKFYELYEASFKDDTKLMFQLPTWASNPNVQKKYLESKRISSPETFDIFFGAQFGSGSDSPWLDINFINDAFATGYNRKRAEFGEPLIKYYAHLDPAVDSDNYTLAIVHTEPMLRVNNIDKPQKRVIVDHIHMWKPKNGHPVQIDEVDSYMLELATKFKFSSITYDHWGSQGSIQKLQTYGLNVKKTTYNGQFQNQIYSELYELFVSNRIDFYGLSTPIKVKEKGIEFTRDLDEVNEAKEQFKFLQRKLKGSQFKIEAQSGKHDDIPDVIAGAAYQALKDQVFEKLPLSRTFSMGGRFR